MSAGIGARLGPWRRTALVGVVVGAAVVGAGATGVGTSGAQTGFNNGTSSALAQSIRVDPVAGGLSFGISIAESLTGHQNTVAQAESRSANLGVIGTSLAAHGCDGGEPTFPKEDQPQPLRVDSTEEGAAEGRSEQDEKVPGVDRFVRATTEPFAETRTTSQGIEIPGALTIGPTVSSTASGVIGELRESVAVSEISSITAGGGAVQLSGLRWVATHRSGDTDEASGTFSIAAATVNGTAIPTEDPTAALLQLNQVLNPLGLDFRPPAHHVDETARGQISTVDPMGVAIIPAPARDGVLGPIQSGAQPVRSELFAAIIEQDCSFASFVTILDVLLAATGAGGELGIELGGVQASTAELSLFSGLGSLPPLPPLQPLGLSPGTAGIAGSSGSTGTAAAAAPPAAPPAAAAAPETFETDDASAIPGERGGAMLAVAGTGLALMALAAEADRRKMRRAMREIPLES